MKLIDPTTYPDNHPMSVALRQVSRHWFLAYSKLMSMQWQHVNWCPYGATDGRRLSLNPAGIDKLCRQKNASGLLAFLLVHEALHALLGHGWRLAPLSNKGTANIAADYVVNALIAQRNREIGREVFPFINGVLLDEQLSGDKSVIQLYRELTKPEPNQPQTNDTNTDEQDNEQEDGPQDGEQDGPQDGEQDNTDTDDGPTISPDSGDPAEGAGDSECGTPDDGGSGDEDPDDLSDFVGTGAQDNVEPKPEDGESQAETIDKIEQDNDRILIADELDKRTSGTSSNIGQRLADERVAGSKLSWPDLLREWLTKHSRAGWNSPMNVPVFQSTGLVSAGRRQKSCGEIVLVLDTSGSIGQNTYNRFLAEAQSVLDELRPERLHLLSVPERVADVHSLQHGDVVPSRLIGGGGTAFRPAFDWVRDNVDDMDVLVYLTDGLSPDINSLTTPDYPVLWLSTYLPANRYPFGEVVMVDYNS